MKTWKRRWFILTDNCLYYFEYTTVSTEQSCLGTGPGPEGALRGRREDRMRVRTGRSESCRTCSFRTRSPEESSPWRT